MTPVDSIVFEQLSMRRNRLVDAIPRSPEPESLRGLLAQVDTALGRLDAGTFGLCTVCHDPVEPDRLAANPLLEVCLDHLSEQGRRALERDLELAGRLQAGLLPARDVVHGGWEVALSYTPASVVSGDYCDVICGPDGGLHVMVGDVSGKGVAAALLMSQLHALFRLLIPGSLSLTEVCDRVNGAFGESIPASHYATLVCGRATSDGALEIVNAGHPPALSHRDGRLEANGSAGLPLGMFDRPELVTTQVTLGRGDFIVFYSDGITEAEEPGGEAFGQGRLERVVTANRERPARALVTEIVKAVTAFTGPVTQSDDRTLTVLRRV